MSARRPGRPPKSDGERTRKALMLATVNRLRNVGYARMTLEDVAADAGITRAAIYRYFSSKQDLTRATVAAYATSLEDVDKEYALLALQARDLADELRAFVQACVRSAISHPTPSLSYYTIASLAQEDPHIRELYQQRAHYISDRLEALIENAEARGEFPAGGDRTSLVEALSGLIWALGQAATFAPNRHIRSQVEAAVSLVLQEPPWLAERATATAKRRPSRRRTASSEAP